MLKDKDEEIQRQRKAHNLAETEIQRLRRAKKYLMEVSYKLDQKTWTY